MFLPGAGGAACAVPLAIRIPRGLALLSLGLFVGLLFGLPLLASASDSHGVALVSGFYRSGALVFGGGHVMLPLLQQTVVPPGWVGNDAFLAGYGAAQALPGPLSTFAAYLGTIMAPAPNGWPGGLLCLAAIYLPSFLLLLGILPFWDALRVRAGVRSAPPPGSMPRWSVCCWRRSIPRTVWTSAIAAPADFAIAIAAFLLLALWQVPPWVVVICGALAATGLAAIG